MKLTKIVLSIMTLIGVSINAGCVGTPRIITTSRTPSNTEIAMGVIKASQNISSYELTMKLNYSYSVGDSVGYEATEAIDLIGKKLHL
jgi:hypothetical protein